MLKALILGLCLRVDYSLPSVEQVMNPPMPPLQIEIVDMLPMWFPPPFNPLVPPIPLKPPPLILPKLNKPIEFNFNNPILRPLVK